jgi:hypothetical protein
MKKSFLLLPLLLCLTGCSTFKKSQRLDLKPFAEYTVNLASDIEFGMTRGAKVHYLMDYRDDPEVKAHNEQWDYVRQLVRAIVAYSVEITTLSGSQLNETEKNHQFALFLDRLVRPAIVEYPDAIRISAAGLDSITADARSQTDFLGALGSAQPVIDEIARLAELIFDDLQDSLDDVADHLLARIEEDNADVNFVRQRLKMGQARYVQSIILLGRIRAGEENLWPELLATEPQLRDYIPTDREPNREDIQRVEDRLFFAMEKIVDWKEQFAPDMAYYRNQVSELDDLYKNAMMHLKKSRVTVMVWSRAHRDLASGVTDPAKIDIFDITKKAVKTVM